MQSLATLDSVSKNTSTWASSTIPASVFTVLTFTLYWAGPVSTSPTGGGSKAKSASNTGWPRKTPWNGSSRNMTVSSCPVKNKIFFIKLTTLWCWCTLLRSDVSVHLFQINLFKTYVWGLFSCMCGFLNIFLPLSPWIGSMTYLLWFPLTCFLEMGSFYWVSNHWFLSGLPTIVSLN